MKKNILKFISAAIIITSVAQASVAFAEYNPDKEINVNEPSTKSIDVKNSIIIDDKIIEDAEIITSVEDNITLFPVRKVFEEMGYTVEWNNETKNVAVVNLPHYITFTIGTDGYTFAKTAPIKLNKAPELIDGITYAPMTLLSEIIEMDASVDENNNLIINTETLPEVETSTESETLTENETSSESESLTENESSAEDETFAEGENSGEATSAEENILEANAKAISVNDDEILINDTEKGEISLVKNEDTEIIFDDGTPASLSDIEKNSNLFVQYGEEMTLSIPPINNPEKIVIFK
ncbi:MAG: copper amine oxidase N-terminal domain-containing protein [Clostridiales bacterium]|nr:copper amine oxidase N-terminal domain-containing protein [Clostridiales bacterium]